MQLVLLWGLLELAEAQKNKATPAPTPRGDNDYWTGGAPVNQELSGLPWTYSIKYTTVQGKRCDAKNQMDVLFMTELSGDSLSPSLHQCSSKCGGGGRGACTANSAGTKTGDVTAPDGTVYEDVPCFCDGMCSATDEGACDRADAEDGTVPALCANQALCQQLCDASKECYGIEMSKDPETPNRCFLLQSDCQLDLLQGTLGDSSSYDYLAKMDPETRGGDEACPLGVAVNPGGLHDLADTCDPATLNDLYYPDADAPLGSIDKYVSSGAACGDRGTSELVWHHSGCGWAVTVPAPVVEPVPVPAPDTACGGAYCSNHEDAANWIFGFEGDEQLWNICEESHPWLDGLAGYCANTLWQALCPESCHLECRVCEAWAQDNEDAAALVVTMLELVPEAGATSCAALKGYSMCSDPVVQVVCGGTCAGERRLASAGQETREHVLEARHKYGAQLKEQLEHARAEQRRLGTEASGARLELYGTWDPTDLPDSCAPGPIRRRTAPDVEILGNGVQALYDLHTFNLPVEDLTIQKQCPPQEIPVYDTVSNMYCQGNNMALQDAPEEVQAELCWKKCLAEDTSGTGSGPTGYCDGKDSAFNSYSNALCVPREQCEAICSSLDECTGFEMHTGEPRCYLNVDECPHELVASTEYDFSTKMFDKRVAYKTHFKRECDIGMTRTWDSLNAAAHMCPTKCANAAAAAAAGEPIAGCAGYVGDRDDDDAVCGERELCEALCTADISCAGFSMKNSVEQDGTYVEMPRCRFKQAPVASKGKAPNLGSTFCTDCKASFLDQSCTLSYAGFGQTANTILPYDANAEWSYVEKKLSGGMGSEVWEVPCRADVMGLREAVQGGAFDELWEPYISGTGDCADSPYDGAAEGGPCYVSSSKEFRLVWGLLDRFDESAPKTDAPGPTSGASLDRMCDGWVMERKEVGSNTYVPIFTTYQNGTACNKAAQTAALAEGELPLYRWRAEVEQVATLGYQCNSYPTCGTLNTCVLSRGRFATELSTMLAPATWTAAIGAKKHQWYSELSQAERVAVFGDAALKPKTLISVEHAKAFVVQAKWRWAQELYRNVPGHLRVRIRAPGAFDKALVTMVSADQTASTSELGVEYVAPAGYSQWYTDIIRIERFAIDSSMLGDNEMKLDVYAPNVPELVMFRMPRGAERDMVLVEGVVAASDYPGWWTVTITKDGDYIGTTKLPCSATPPLSSIANAMPNGDCLHLDSGRTCPLVCALGFSPVSPLTCTLGQWTYVGQADGGEGCIEDASYEAETPLFRLTHRSRLDYGWRIRAVFFYSDEACTQSISGGEVVGTSGDYAGFPPSSIVQTSEGQLKDESNCANDARACPDWWSSGLNVNPYAVDETHGAAVHVDFNVPASADVQCVRVFSRSIGEGKARQYFPTEQVLYRGWSANVRQAGPLAHSPVTVDGWTETWTASADIAEAGDQGMVTTFVSTCGERDTIIYAELLEHDDNIPSACHCQQLCIDNIANGCRTWKFKVEASTCTGKKCPAAATGGTCYLQSDLVSKVSFGDHADSCVSALGWISGDTGMRLTGASPAEVTPGQTFDLRISGVNMPSDGAHSTTPPRQRIKVIAAGQACAESSIAQHVSGIRCSHPYFCAPKPAAWGPLGDSATWANVKIHSSATARAYTVCYNRGATYDRYEWHTVPTTLSVDSNNFKWATIPATLSRKTPQFNITVSSLLMPAAPEDWRIKVIRSYFDCDNIATDTSKLGLAFDSGINSDTLMDVTWADVTLYDAAAATPIVSDAGRYKVCFAESDAGPFLPIPGPDGGLYLEVAPEADDSAHPRDVYTYQTLSGKLDQEITLTLGGHRLRLPSTSAISIIPNGTKCGTNASGMNYTARVSEADSDASGQVFKLTVATDLDNFAGIRTPGTYDVCYCDSQSDSSIHGETGGWNDANATFTVTVDRGCTSMPANVTEKTDNDLATTAVGAAFQDDFCAHKCARGCSGQNCFCDSFDPDTMLNARDKDAADTAAPLCLSAMLCRDACLASTGCAGFDFDPERNFCWLRSAAAGAGCPFREGIEAWESHSGSACTRPEDFATKAGVVTLTARPDIGTAWVLTPGEVQSIEVTGSDLDWNYDRVMLIEGTGTCGVSDGAESVAMQPHVAENDFIDGPSDDQEGPYEAPAAGPGPAVYNSAEGHYCSGNNLPWSDLKETDLARHQCYRKCSLNSPCHGDDCFCGGLYAGYDGADSSALCLDEASCRAACADRADCVGIDMHTGRDRCFLNVAQPAAQLGSCERQVTDGTLTAYDDYSFIYKQHARRQRRLAEDQHSVSWSELLRFKDVLVPTGGYLKACFCDPATLAAATCRTKADYKVEIGTVHVSGVSCLIADPKLQRGACKEQRFAGLRCYESEIIDPQPPAIAATLEDDSTDAPAAPAAPVAPAVSAWCLYGPEEETRDDPACRSA